MNIIVFDEDEERSNLLNSQLSTLSVFKSFRCSNIDEMTNIISNNTSIDVVFIYACPDNIPLNVIKKVLDSNNIHEEGENITIICYTEEPNNLLKTELKKAGADNLISLYLPPQMFSLAVRSTVNALDTITGLKALVVDDSVLSRKMISTALKHNGVEVYEAVNGDEAITYIEKNGHELSVVFLDDNMPGKSGREIAKFIKEDLGFTDMVIIFVVSQNDELTSEDFYGVGASDYIVKPLRKKELMAKTFTHLSRMVLLENLEMALHSVTKIEKERRDLIEVCAHDILTPLTSIVGLTELVIEANEDELDTIKADAQKIHDSCKNIWEATNKILKKHK